MRRIPAATVGALIAAAVAAAVPHISAVAGDARADRVVFWTTSAEAGLERDLNAQAARGLRATAVSDGLPCSVTAMQAPAKPEPAAAYRVVTDRNLASALGELAETGFVPRFASRSVTGRAQVIFERAGTARAVVPWRIIEFADLTGLEPALAAAAREGFQPRVLVRPAFKSWPGLSEKGLVLAARTGPSAPREARVLVGTTRKIDDLAKTVHTMTSGGWTLDLLFSQTRDGSQNVSQNPRRERLVIALSRDPGGPSAAAPVTLERSSTFGMFGSGAPSGAVPFWNEYAYAWSPAPRRQVWASPIRLTANEASCLSLNVKLRIDAPHDHTWSIIGLIGRPIETGGYELVYLTDQGS